MVIEQTSTNAARCKVFQEEAFHGAVCLLEHDVAFCMLPSDDGSTLILVVDQLHRRGRYDFFFCVAPRTACSIESGLVVTNPMP